MNEPVAFNSALMSCQRPKIDDMKFPGNRSESNTFYQTVGTIFINVSYQLYLFLSLSSLLIGQSFVTQRDEISLRMFCEPIAVLTFPSILFGTGLVFSMTAKVSLPCHAMQQYFPSH